MDKLTYFLENLPYFNTVWCACLTAWLFIISFFKGIRDSNEENAMTKCKFTQDCQYRNQTLYDMNPEKPRRRKEDRNEPG